ncbi:MAG: ABC transporter substrate-binding protein [Candidatus Rokubacteria bacterium]|nr:ABC transporter substrate-binding protein [Candidatus Rokubacteria bacterium]
MTAYRTIASVIALSLGVLAAPLAADAQQSAKVHRIGWLGQASPGPEVLRIVDAFRQGLRELGYVEGQNLILEYRWAQGKIERLPDLAAELVRLKVDFIIVATTPSAFAARQATSTIPIVMVAGPVDPVAQGLVASLARPGGNVTGLVLLPGPEIAGKYLEIFKEAAPRLSQVAVLWNPGNLGHSVLLREMGPAARVLRLRLHPMEARTPDDFDSAFSAMTRAGADGLVVLADPNTFLHRKRLADLAMKSRLPNMHALTEFVEAGGLIAYSPSFPDVARRAATYVDKIVKGTKPGDLPIELPTRFELVINLKTAKALGVTIPRSMLLRADRVIE